MKNLISITLSFLLAFSVCATTSATLTAKAESVTDPATELDFDEATGAVTGYEGSATILTVPASINGTAVTRIDDSAFSGMNFTKVTLPDSIKSIGSLAFSMCESLTSVNLPAGITSIGDEAFSDCPLLNGITLPSGITRIGEGTFSGCEKLTSIVIPSSVKYIDQGAFATCMTLQNIAIPDGVVYIGSGAFCMTSVSNLTLPNSVETIGSGAFSCCPYLSSVTLPSGLKDLSNDAFQSSPTLTSFQCAAGSINFASVGGVLFNHDKTELKIFPQGKTGDYAIPDGVTTIDENAFFDCPLLTEVSIPESVHQIGNSVFNQCPSLDKVTIPSSVTDIAEESFSGCLAMTITGVSGSYAQAYASDHGIPFTATDLGLAIAVNPYNTEPTNQDVTVTAAASSGTLNAASHTFTQNGSFDFIATDGDNSVTKTVTVTNIDKTKPAVTGVANNKTYSTAQTVSFNEGTATLNDKPFQSGTAVSADGDYTLIVTDAAGNNTVVRFTIQEAASAPFTVNIAGSQVMGSLPQGSSDLQYLPAATIFVPATTSVIKPSDLTASSGTIELFKSADFSDAGKVGSDGAAISGNTLTLYDRETSSGGAVTYFKLVFDVVDANARYTINGGNDLTVTDSKSSSMGNVYTVSIDRGQAAKIVNAKLFVICTLTDGKTHVCDVIDISSSDTTATATLVLDAKGIKSAAVALIDGSNPDFSNPSFISEMITLKNI